MMKKRSFDGGVASVRVIPMGMKEGGDLSVPPPKTSKPAPKQFYLREEETVIPSEPRVQPRTMDQRGQYFSIPQITGPIPSEPGITNMPGADQVTEGTTMQDRFMYGPVIDPREVYPNDPDPGIMSLPGIMSPGLMGINPNLLQAKDLKPAGILSINKVYDI